MSGVARAMLFDGPGQPLRAVEALLPPRTVGETLVRVEMCTLCGSDLHTYHGRRHGPTPVILGHEIVGRVEALPSRGKLLDRCGQMVNVGDRIVWGVVASCRACRMCERGLPQKCERGFKYGHVADGPDSRLAGGLATHCILRQGTSLIVVPESVPLPAFGPVGCATATVRAALPDNYPHTTADRSVVIFGLGMLGLTACATAKVGGAAAVIACDPDERRRALAERFGATHVCAPDGLADVMGQVAGRYGADHVWEFSGATRAIQAALDVVGTGCECVLVGSVFPSEAIQIRPEDVVRRYLRIRGVHNYHPDLLVDAVAFLAKWHPHYPFADLVSATFPLEQADEAFRVAATGEHVRVAVVP